jgi:hypothetical protein
MAKPELRRVLAVLSKSSATFGYEVAIDSLEEALRLGAVDSYSFQALSSRMVFKDKVRQDLISGSTIGPLWAPRTARSEETTHQQI